MKSTLETILESGLVAIIRHTEARGLIEVMRAIAAGGIRVAEVTFTVPDAVEVLKEAKKSLKDDVLLGAGTVLDPETCRAALLAGAEFIVSPTVNREVIAMCRRYNKVVMPGAFTPTEILTAWEAGADIVKVFPSEVLGPAFFRAVLRPLPQVRLMPTGGVELKSVADYVKAGACCLGIGSPLVDPKWVASQDYSALTQRAKEFVDALRKARQQV
jgi:2-dehydro-3-deoxyphosphogluconate aldolase/(4S)-4-hydroxy-2-oxoglutarate aldolase